MIYVLTGTVVKVRCHNVQRCWHHFRNIQRHSIRKTANSSFL